MRILVSNDDGIYSPGLAALATVAMRFGEVRIVAPDVEQSSMSQAITSTRPLSYRKTKIPGFEAYRVNGTPSDCVALGTFDWGEVDLVLSGINLGSNLGNAIWHSGTVAAAKQAVLLGMRGIAFSFPVEESNPEGETDFAPIMPWVEKALVLLLAHAELRLVNVNLPLKPSAMRWTRQSVGEYDGKVVRSQDPMGRKNYWYTVTPVKATEEGTDRWAIAQGLVALTPLRIDLTDDARLSDAIARHPLVEN
ncbi:MAG TPA: 5'/3'-nucleotidase SurE [Opitutaceae bacterium]|jgi:5'-nucleotidase